MQLRAHRDLRQQNAGQADLLARCGAKLRAFNPPTKENTVNLFESICHTAPPHFCTRCCEQGEQKKM